MNYQKTKSLVLRLLPKTAIRWLDRPLRYLYWWANYRGTEVYCNVCRAGSKAFIDSERTTGLCPRCGSLPRNRRLIRLLDNVPLDSITLLHFSPSMALRRHLSKRIRSGQYWTSDFVGEFNATLQLDITDIDLEDECVDVIICYHVLEHIDQDEQAMLELFRILKPGGRAYIQTPFKEGAVYEDAGIIDPSDRLTHFGQEDHVRIYSVESLAKRLSNAGFSVNILFFDADEKTGLRAGEGVLIAEKKE